MDNHNPSGEGSTLNFDPQPIGTQGLPHLPEREGWAPDWWRCRRVGPVSGTYEGEMTTPKAGSYSLDLRVDIDPRHANSPVMNRVSGDIYRLFRFRLPSRIRGWQVYQKSWIVDSPRVEWSKCQVEITGRVRYWSVAGPITKVRIIIPWGRLQPPGPADVTFSAVDGDSWSFVCDKKSSHFRGVTLEVDVCDSVNRAPILPSYDTCAHSTRPLDLPCRTLTIEEAYAEAGIDLTVNPARSIIDDGATTFDSWSVDELHDAMEQYFSEYGHRWPRWRMWCLLAGTFDTPGVAGIMFDAGAAYGGAGEPPERQGCALFREHPWFDALVATPPSNDDQAAALRKFLYCYIHEMGHAFNFLHSWDKGRADALSWMNYDWKYDYRNGPGSFWGDFRLRFDDEELIHLRHGDRASVIMGGDPWASGGHLEAPAGAMADLVGEPPVELLLRSKGYFQFMEPVVIELRIRNMTELPLELDTELDPEFGGVTVYIRRPDGRVLEYAPVLCKLATAELKVLKPEAGGVRGEDRHSQNVFLSYGAHGYCFDEPGEYLLRAVYQGAGDLLIPSNVHRLRMGHPFSHDDERIAQQFFTYETGMALYLGGSSSPFLKNGMHTLETIADRYRDSAVGAHLSVVLARNLARPFFRIEKARLVEARPTDSEQALALTARALEQQERDESTFTNIAYHQLRRTRADLMAGMGEKPEAKKELKTLVNDLKRRGVNQPVLDEINAYAKAL